jgi:hypothetical protein
MLLYGIHGWMYSERNRVGVLPLLRAKNKRGQTMKCWNDPFLDMPEVQEGEGGAQEQTR